MPTRAAGLFAIASLILPALASVVAVSGFVHAWDFEKKGLFVFLWFRGLAAVLALVLILGVGMNELFTVSHFRPLPKQGRNA